MDWTKLAQVYKHFENSERSRFSRNVGYPAARCHIWVIIIIISLSILSFLFLLLSHSCVCLFVCLFYCDVLAYFHPTKKKTAPWRHYFVCIRECYGGAVCPGFQYLKFFDWFFTKLRATVIRFVGTATMYVTVCCCRWYNMADVCNREGAATVRNVRVILSSGMTGCVGLH